jgi:hypothetical protein
MAITREESKNFPDRREKSGIRDKAAEARDRVV